MTSFAVRRGEIRKRSDVWFNLPLHRAIEKRIRNSRYRVTTLGDRAIISRLVDGPFGTQVKVEDYRDNGVPLLRVSNCRDNEVSDDDLVYISPELHARLLRSEVLPGDVVLTKTGHILGYAAVFPKRHERANMTSHLVLMRPTEELSAAYLAAFLRTSVGQDQIYRWGQKATKPELNTIEIRQFLIPVPDRDQQVRLLSRLDSARAISRQKLEEAGSLLGDLDAFVFNALGLTLSLPRVHRTTYAVRLAQVSKESKLYPDYFHPERLSMIREVERKYSKTNCGTLQSLVTFHRDQRRIRPNDNYLGLANVQPNTGERVETTEEDGEGAVFEYAKKDVLFGRLRPYLNKVYLAESDGVCSPEFHVMRVRTGTNGRPRIIPEYLAAILRSTLVLSQTRHMMTGNTHPRLANDDVVNLVVPVPNEEKQQAIGLEVSRRRDSARRLRAGAAKLWDDAKFSFEAELLAPAK